VNSWIDANGQRETETTTESTITANGKTYRSYKQELSTATPPDLQTRSLYFCR
jgi:hypothetical protein